MVNTEAGIETTSAGNSQHVTIPCLLRIRLGEPDFTLLGRDAAAARTIRFWCLERQKLGMNRASDEKIKSAYALAEQFEKYQAGHDAAGDIEDGEGLI